MKYVSPEYQERLDRLAEMLCPVNEVVEINPLTIPREEGGYQSIHDHMHWEDGVLVEDDYYPAPQIVPDTREGFDMSGDFHAVEHFSVEGLGSAITPYRWASYLQDALEQYMSTSDYTMGRADQDDFVQDLISERMESLDNMQDRYRLEEALEIWRNRNA